MIFPKNWKGQYGAFQSARDYDILTSNGNHHFYSILVDQFLVHLRIVALVTGGASLCEMLVLPDQFPVDEETAVVRFRRNRPRRPRSPLRLAGRNLRHLAEFFSAASSVWQVTQELSFLAVVDVTRTNRTIKEKRMAPVTTRPLTCFSFGNALMFFP